MRSGPPSLATLGERSGCHLIFTWKALSFEISLALANNPSLFLLFADFKTKVIYS